MTDPILDPISDSEVSPNDLGYLIAATYAGLEDALRKTIPGFELKGEYPGRWEEVAELVTRIIREDQLLPNNAAALRSLNRAKHARRLRKHPPKLKLVSDT